MKFIFYQNIISIHQNAFLTALAKRHDVTLIVERAADQKRYQQGWNLPEFINCTIVKSPTPEQLSKYVSQEEAIHIFSGITAFPLVKYAFEQSLKYPIRRFIYSEPFRTDSFKGILRKLYYFSLYLRYDKYISAYLVTGKLGIDCYRRAGYPYRKIWEWGYFTTSDKVNFPQSPNAACKILFIGTLDHRKNILELTHVLRSLQHNFTCSIVGNGPLHQHIKDEIAGDERFTMLGNIPNSEIGNVICQHDILVLPSIFDGWGAVVNEALQCGTRVIVSEKCGAACLIQTPQQGEVFQLSGKNGLSEVLKHQLTIGIQSTHDREQLCRWAEKHISGNLAAHYFEQICLWDQSNNARPQAPWRV